VAADLLLTVIRAFSVSRSAFLPHIGNRAVLMSLIDLVLTRDAIEMQFADYQVPGYRQDPAVIGNAGCYRIQVN